jgi:hypothetical protein
MRLVQVHRPAQKPTWKGKRFRFYQLGRSSIFWDEYVQPRQAHPDDEFGRIAHAFYLENRVAMDAGADVANRNRFDGQTLPDGTQLEVSALQRYYNEVARIGPEAVASEYDNDRRKPGRSSPGSLDRSSGFRVRPQIVPPGCTVLDRGDDVRKTARTGGRAWQPAPASSSTTACMSARDKVRQRRRADSIKGAVPGNAKRREYVSSRAARSRPWTSR